MRPSGDASLRLAAMAYATRPMHDADSHIMEPPAGSQPTSPPTPGAASRARCWPTPTSTPGRSTSIASAARRIAIPSTGPRTSRRSLLRKNFPATGSFIEADRPRALDLLGFASQLVFDTFTSSHVLRFDRDGDHELAIDVARGPTPGDARLVLGRPAPAPGVRRAARRHGGRGRAHARGDRRGRGRVCRSASTARRATRRATSTLEPMWATCAEAGVPVVLHVAGAGANVMAPDFFENGLPPVPDFHGGDTQLQVDRLPLDPAPGDADAERAGRSTVCCMRHPTLRIGVIEVGATWVPGWMRCSTPPTRRSARTRSACSRWICGRASTCSARCASLRIRTRTRAGRSRTRATTCACSRPTSRTWKAAGTRSAASSAAWTPPARSRGARDRFYGDNFVDLLGPVLDRRGLRLSR